MSDDWTPEQTERLLALVAVGEPFWARHAERLLLSLGQVRLAERLFAWAMRRAVRLYREGRR